MLGLYLDLPAFSVAIMLMLASTQDHTHYWLFDLSSLIGQYLNSLCVIFRKKSCTGHIARLILSSLPLLSTLDNEDSLIFIKFRS